MSIRPNQDGCALGLGKDPLFLFFLDGSLMSRPLQSNFSLTDERVDGFISVTVSGRKRVQEEMAGGTFIRIWSCRVCVLLNRRLPRDTGTDAARSVYGYLSCDSKRRPDANNFRMAAVTWFRQTGSFPARRCLIRRKMSFGSKLYPSSSQAKLPKLRRATAARP